MKSLLNNSKSISVCQGDLSVSRDPEVVLTCILGSCIATCLHDPQAKVGGMNHILLPGTRGSDSRHNKFGVYSMEALINELMRNGALKRNLVAKIYGGASTFKSDLGIGEQNAAFVKSFLQAEGIPIQIESTGGKQARRIRFFPHTGEAKQMLTAESVSQAPPPRARRAAVPAASSGEVELF